MSGHGMSNEVDQVACCALILVESQETNKDTVGIAQTRGPITAFSVSITGGERTRSGKLQEIVRVANDGAGQPFAYQKTTKDNMGIAQTRGSVNAVSVSITDGERSSHGHCSETKFFSRPSVSVS